MQYVHQWKSIMLPAVRERQQKMDAIVSAVVSMQVAVLRQASKCKAVPADVVKPRQGARVALVPSVPSFDGSEEPPRRFVAALPGAAGS
eukprot:8657298-Alexandrium_andersonii.AAC.1